MRLGLTFLGAAGTVTGSKFLLQDGQHRILIDCGLFQGLKELRLKNWAPLPLPASEIAAVLLTHAHIDHSGHLPLLVREGFAGPILCSRATAELSGILLPDSGFLQEKDVEFANRHGFSKHHPALPLYTETDARRALQHLKPLAFEADHPVPGGARMRMRRAGHILGAASVRVDWRGRSVVVSGDIGRFNDLVMPDPEPFEQADYLLIEGTYGDRRHDQTDPEAALADIVSRTVGRGGTVIIPAFAVGRAQSLLVHFHRIKSAGGLANVPIFLDSPMATDAGEVYRRNGADHKLSDAECRTAFGTARYVRSAEDSKALTAETMPKVIISASGMATGGRVLHHIKHYAPDSRNTILFAGYQAAGTRGAAMLAGAESVKIHGAYVPVNAEVDNLDMLSAHADADELMRWLRGFRRPPRQTFIVHAEPAAADALRRRIEDELGWPCLIPQLHQQVDLA